MKNKKMRLRYRYMLTRLQKKDLRIIHTNTYLRQNGHEQSAETTQVERRRQRTKAEVIPDFPGVGRCYEHSVTLAQPQTCITERARARRPPSGARRAWRRAGFVRISTRNTRRHGHVTHSRTSTALQISTSPLFELRGCAPRESQKKRRQAVALDDAGGQQ